MLRALAARAGTARLGPVAQLAASDVARSLTTSAASYQKGKGKPAAPTPEDAGKPGAPKQYPPSNIKYDEGDDIVIRAAKWTLQNFRDLVNGLKDITVPLTGDDAAIQKYADEVHALKKKIGMPEREEEWKAMVEYKHKAYGENPRKFLQSASEGMTFTPEAKAVMDEFYAAISEAEAASGKPLGPDNPEGKQMLKDKIQVIAAKYGLNRPEEVVFKEERFKRAKLELADIKAKVENHIEGLKRQFDMPWIKVDLSNLKPK